MIRHREEVEEREGLEVVVGHYLARLPLLPVIMSASRTQHEELHE